MGYKGEEVVVAPGYARNFLVPQGKAVYATEAARRQFKVQLPEGEARAIAAQREVNMLRARIASVTLRFARATSDGTTLFSGITAADVVEALNASSVLRKLGVREKGVSFESPPAERGSSAGAGDGAIKLTGEHTIRIEPRAGLWCPIKVVVESS